MDGATAVLAMSVRYYGGYSIAFLTLSPIKDIIAMLEL